MKRASLLAIAAIITATLFLAGCRERTIFTGAPDWLLLATDANESGVAYNADSLYVDADFADNDLEFKVVTWAPIPNAAINVQFAVFFDTDGDAATGLSTSTPGTWERPNDIGADYMMFVGTDTTLTGTQNTNIIYRWNATVTPPIWEEVGPIAPPPYQPTNGDSVKGTVTLANLGTPTGAIYVMAILLCNPGTSELRDHIPDTGHATINLATDSVIQASPSLPLAGPLETRYQTGHVSLITGKVIDLVEVK